MKSNEIYPRIVVYKDIFKDIANTYNILENFDEEDPKRIFSKWSKWSTFGKYLQPISTMVDWEHYDINKGVASIDESFDKNQKDVIIEIMNAFNAASEDYFSRYSLEINLEENIQSHDGNFYKLWRRVAPVICRYDMLSYEDRLMAMRYHSDYIREPFYSPGYKFAITALFYFNDDYEGGEIEFAVGNKLIKYKPVAGDLVIFPSGNPEIKELQEEGLVYLHGVHPVTSGSNKLFLRMFWQKYNYGSDEWISQYNSLGKEKWETEYEAILANFRKNNPQRGYIPNSVNLEPKIN